MGSNICLKLLITSILLTISCSTQQDGDTTGSSDELNKKWDDFKVEYGIKSITQGPSNAVAEIGKQVILTCTAETPIAYWVLSKDGTETDQLIIVGPGCFAVNSPFFDHYAVVSLGGGTTCNLIVFNITMAQAGVYSCSEAQNKLFSILTVIENFPSATYNTTENVVVEKDNVIITCSLNHNGSVAPAPTLRPYFYWKNFTGHNVNSSYDSTTENTAVSQITVRAGRQNITSYACHVQLQLSPPATAYYANNIPPVNSSASSTTIEVLYGVVGVGFSISSQLIAIGGITCEIGVVTGWSSGNPPAIYEWFDTKENVSVINNQTLDLAEINRNYTCTAYNTIRNEVHRGSHFYVAKSYKTTQDCRFPRNEITWIAAVPVQDCYNGTCACSSGYDGYTLLCNANSYPNALYQWIGADNNATCPRLHENVETEGIYRCTAYFDQASSNYTGNVIFPNGTSEKNVTECCNTSCGPTYQPIACDSNDVAIAMSVLFSISLAVHITILINCLRKTIMSQTRSF